MYIYGQGPSVVSWIALREGVWAERMPVLEGMPVRMALRCSGCVGLKECPCGLIWLCWAERMPWAEGMPSVDWSCVAVGGGGGAKTLENACVFHVSLHNWSKNLRKCMCFLSFRNPKHQKTLENVCVFCVFCLLGGLSTFRTDTSGRKVAVLLKNTENTENTYSF